MSSNIKDIKSRIKSIKSTMQITKAMELVAVSKIPREKQRLENSFPYLNSLNDALYELKNENIKLSFFDRNKSDKSCAVIISGDRGLAGGFNLNVIKKFENENNNMNFYTVPIGKKVTDFCIKRNYKIINNSFYSCDDMDFLSSKSLSEQLIDLYINNEIGNIIIYYTKVISPLNQIPVSEKIFPVSDKDEKRQKKFVLVESDGEEWILKFMKNYLTGYLYSCICHSKTAELYSRRIAMDSANRNANEIIDDLSIKYNRARQGEITQEISEIISGASMM